MDIKFNDTKKGLFQAVIFGNRAELRRIIKNGIEVNAKDSDGWTPLMIATDRGDIETVKLLIELGADVNLLNSDGESALMLSAYCDNEKIGRFLIEKGASVTIKDKIGRTAYDIAEELFPGKNHEYLKEQEKTIIPEESNNKNIPEKEIPKDKKTILKRHNSIVLEEDYKRFFNLIFFIKKGGTKVDYYSIEKSFKNHFHKEFSVILVYKYINYFNNLHKTEGGGDGKSIKELDTGDFLILPSVNEKETFFRSCFCITDNIEIINLESIKKSYREKFYIELEMKDLWAFISSHNDINSKIKELENGDFEINQGYVKPNIINTSEQSSLKKYGTIYPSKKDIFISFLHDTFLNVKTDSCVSYHSLNDAFKTKFGLDLNPIYIQYFMKYFNSQYKDLEITETDTGEYKLAYPNIIIEQYIDSIFRNKKIGIKISLSEIQKSIKDKFNIDFNEKHIAVFLSNHINIETYRNDQDELFFFTIPSKDEVYKFFVEYLNRDGYASKLMVFSFMEMNNSFYNQYNSFLVLEDFMEWIKISKTKESFSYIIEMLPYEIFIRRPVLTIPDNIFSVTIPSKLNRKYSSFLSEYENSINKYLNQKGLILRPLEKNKDEYIITYDDIESIDNSGLIKEIIKLFLEEKVGFEFSVNEIEEKYDLSFDYSVYSNIIDIVNSSFQDLKIVYDIHKKTLKSEFKTRTIDSIMIEHTIIECPVCGLRSDHELFKKHYLSNHVSQSFDKSIIVSLDSGYYCHHCNNFTLQLQKVPALAIIRHLTSTCKENKHTIANKNISNLTTQRIWQGFSYANNITFLGNSGQLYRDNGRFGSYPVEENYD